LGYVQPSFDLFVSSAQHKKTMDADASRRWLLLELQCRRKRDVRIHTRQADEVLDVVLRSTDATNVAYAMVILLRIVLTKRGWTQRHLTQVLDALLCHANCASPRFAEDVASSSLAALSVMVDTKMTKPEMPFQRGALSVLTRLGSHPAVARNILLGSHAIGLLTHVVNGDIHQRQEGVRVCRLYWSVVTHGWWSIPATLDEQRGCVLAIELLTRTLRLLLGTIEVWPVINITLEKLALRRLMPMCKQPEFQERAKRALGSLLHWLRILPVAALSLSVARPLLGRLADLACSEEFEALLRAKALFVLARVASNHAKSVLSLDDRLVKQTIQAARQESCTSLRFAAMFMLRSCLNVMVRPQHLAHTFCVIHGFLRSGHNSPERELEWKDTVAHWLQRTRSLSLMHVYYQSCLFRRWRGPCIVCCNFHALDEC
jgi:hypothetical protein